LDTESQLCTVNVYVYGYLRTTHAHKGKIIIDVSDDDKRMINENG